MRASSPSRAPSAATYAAWADRLRPSGGWVCVDSHTEGEPTRLLVSGGPDLSVGDMADKRAALARGADHVRGALMREPRGHRDLFGAVLTPPVGAGAAFGLVYMDARRYPYLCGHATIGAVTTWLELGEAPDGAHEVVVDTPSGPVAARAEVRAGRAVRVALTPEPALVYRHDVPLPVPGRDPVPADVVLAGGFFVMVPAASVGVRLGPEMDARAVARLGMQLRDVAQDTLTVRHPTRPYIDSVDVVSFYGPAEAGADGRNAIVYGDAHVDRSPCGTGTCARMALAHARGELAVGERFVNEGPLGSRFTGEVLEETTVGGLRAIRPRVAGRAYLTGVHTFHVTPEDPFPQGYLL